MSWWQRRRRDKWCNSRCCVWVLHYSNNNTTTCTVASSDCVLLSLFLSRKWRERGEREREGENCFFRKRKCPRLRSSSFFFLGAVARRRNPPRLHSPRFPRKKRKDFLKVNGAFIFMTGLIFNFFSFCEKRGLLKARQRKIFFSLFPSLAPISAHLVCLTGISNFFLLVSSTLF